MLIESKIILKYLNVIFFLFINRIMYVIEIDDNAIVTTISAAGKCIIFIHAPTNNIAMQTFNILQNMVCLIELL